MNPKKQMLTGTSSLFVTWNGRPIPHAPDNGTGNGNNGGNGDNGNNQNNNGDNKNKEPNRLENIFASNKDLWQTEPEQKDPDAEERQRKEVESTNTRLQEHVKSKKFAPDIDPTKFKEALESNNPAVLQEVINEATQAAYHNMLQDATKMMNNMQERIRKEMDIAAQNRIKVSDTEKSLFDKLPFAAEPAIKPIALAIKSAGLKKGMNDEEANTFVEKFFAETAQNLGYAKHDGKGAPRRMPGNNGSRVAEDETDWAAVLTGQSSD